MGGDIALTKLYRRKCEPVVCWMHVVGLVNSEALVGFFKPEEFRTALQAAPGEIEPPPIQSR
jgi:hypothetical protein